MTSDPNYPVIPASPEHMLAHTNFVLLYQGLPQKVGEVLYFVGEGYYMVRMMNVGAPYGSIHQRLVHVSEMGQLFDPVDYKWLFFANERDRCHWMAENRSNGDALCD